MGDIKNRLQLLLFVALALPSFGNSPDSIPYEPVYEINRIYPSISISEDKLTDVVTLKDLNDRYKPSWVKEYFSVEINGLNNGFIQRAIGKNDTLTEAQLDLIAKADLGTDITVKVIYDPSNTLSQNDPKEIKFSFSIDPKNDAEFTGGQKPLQQYLEDHAASIIPKSVFKQYQLTSVKFVIDETGQVIDAQIVHTSNDESADKILLDAICKMPKWKPAQYANGTKVKQEFALLVGDMYSCTLNLLNVRKIPG